jgi:hypothetical protein
MEAVRGGATTTTAAGITTGEATTEEGVAMDMGTEGDTSLEEGMGAIPVTTIGTMGADVVVVVAEAAAKVKALFKEAKNRRRIQREER